MVDIAINGLGRMGRQIFRSALRRGFNICSLNDVANWDTLVYLMRFDTTHGNFDFEYTISGSDMVLNYEGKTFKIRLNNAKHTENIDTNGAQLAIECSGKHVDSLAVSPYLRKVEKVIVASNTNDNTPTYVLGVNHNEYRGESIISNASCTTNCIAPICKLINDRYGISSGFLTTIHSYTNNQSLLDSAHSDKRRSRSAPNNIIPTSTGALEGLARVSGIDCIKGQSIRVPVMNVSMADLSLYLKDDFCDDQVKSLLIQASKSHMSGIIEIDQNERVSSDFNGSFASCIVPLDLIGSSGNLLKLVAWYDNEIGYCNRVLDMALHIFGLDCNSTSNL